MVAVFTEKRSRGEIMIFAFFAQHLRPPCHGLPRLPRPGSMALSPYRRPTPTGGQQGRVERPLGGCFAAYRWSTKKSTSRNAKRHHARAGQWSGELTARVLAACAVDGDRCQVYPQRVPRRCSTTSYIAASIIAKLQHKTLTRGACTNTVNGCD